RSWCCWENMVATKNSSPSSCSSWAASPAAVKAAMAASAASASGSSRAGTRCRVARVASSSTLASSRRPWPRSVSRARLGSGGSPGSARALRSRSSWTSGRATASRSAWTWSMARWPRPAAWSNSRSAWAASAWLTSVAIATPIDRGAILELPGPPVFAPAGHGAGLGLVAELIDVLVDQAQLALPVQGVADHPGCQLDGQGADLVAELPDGLVALGPDGLAGPLELAAGVGLGLGQQVTPDPLGVGPGLVEDPLGLVLGGTGPPPATLHDTL